MKLVIALIVVALIIVFIWYKPQYNPLPAAEKPAAGGSVTVVTATPVPGTGAETAKEGYCPNLMRKYGMCNAGAP